MTREQLQEEQRKHLKEELEEEERKRSEGSICEYNSLKKQQYIYIINK